MILCNDEQNLSFHQDRLLERSFFAEEDRSRWKDDGEVEIRRTPQYNIQIYKTCWEQRKDFSENFDPACQAFTQ